MAEVNTESVHISLSTAESDALLELLDAAAEGKCIPLDSALNELYDALRP